MHTIRRRKITIMEGNYNGYSGVMDLPGRIEEMFPELDSEVCVELRESDSSYAKMFKQQIGLQKKYPAIVKITEIGAEGDGAIEFSAEEHKALVQFLLIKHRMEGMERKQLYIQGHRDNYAYLVKTAGLHIG
jgi:hypothetical protein